VPFLHVYPNNPAAALYTRLGFIVRATVGSCGGVPLRRRR
jgi:hypothetical protein